LEKEDSKEALMVTKSLGEDCKQLYKYKAYKQAINRYEKTIHYLFVFTPNNKE